MEDKKAVNTDIVIIGGGLVGLCQALLLAQNNFNVICIDKDTTEKSKASSHNARTTAVSYGSHQLFKSLGLWERLLPHACAIKDIHVLDGNSPVLMELNAHEAPNKPDAFGWVIENKYIHGVLFNAISEEKNITYKDGESVTDFKNTPSNIQVILEDEVLSAALVIGADGRQSFTREWMNVGTRCWSYNQLAIVSIVTHEKPHNNLAVEHFRSEGPFAILPMTDNANGEHRSSIVWTEDITQDKSALHYNDDVYRTALNNRFPSFYGDVKTFSNRIGYPLNFSHAYDYIAERMVLIGDAAHGIHPIAGQGLNLGLRDVSCLNNVLTDAKDNDDDIGDINVLEKYQSQRRPDNTVMAFATDTLNSLFSNDITPVKLGRKIGMKVMNKLGIGKKSIIQYAMGKSGSSVK